MAKTTIIERITNFENRLAIVDAKLTRYNTKIEKLQNAIQVLNPRKVKLEIKIDKLKAKAIKQTGTQNLEED